MAHVANHLSVSELERRFVDCVDPVEARHVQVIWLLAQGHTVGATSKVTAFGSRWIEQPLERDNASGLDALADGHRRNGPKPRLLTPEVLELVRLRLAEPPPDGGLWSSRRVADVMAAHLGLKPVLRSVWAPKGQRPTALGHHRFQWLSVAAFVGPGTGEAVWYMSNGVFKPLFAGLIAASAKAVGAGPTKRIVLLHRRCRLPHPPQPRRPGRHRAGRSAALQPLTSARRNALALVDEPIVGKLVPSLDDLMNTIGARCRDLAERQTETSSRTDLAWWPKNHAPA